MGDRDAEVQEDLQRIVSATLQAGGHPPWLLVEGERSSSQLALSWLPDIAELRTEILRAYGAAFRINLGEQLGSLRRVYWISEAWMTMHDDTEEWEQAGRLLPSQDPMRIEILCVSMIECPSERMALYMWKMIRDQEGNLIDLLRVAPGEHLDPVVAPWGKAFVGAYASQNEGKR